MPPPLIGKFSSSFLDFRESVIQNLFLVCNAIITSRSTSLYILKDYLPVLLENEQTQSLSHYKRLIRFFRISKPDLLVSCILKWVYKLLSSKTKYLILDGTLWARGDKWVHLLTLCVVYRQVAIPIYWHQLDKNGGTSSQADRMVLMKEALKIFDLSGKILIADREFVGEDWFEFLTGNKIDFVIRLSKSCYKKVVNQSWGNTHAYLEKKAQKRKSPVGKVFELNEVNYSFVAVKNTKNDTKEPVLFLISSLSDIKTIANIYRIRWKAERRPIETCFRQLKSQGFNLENLNFTDDKKITLMVAIVVMAYVLSIYQGLEDKIQKLKKYKSGQKTLAISIFRKGLTKIKAAAWNFHRFLKLLETIFDDVMKTNPLIVQ